MHHETLTYTADGLTFRSAFFAQPGATALSGVLVFPEAYGLGEHARDRAQTLAGMGYAALACDLHGEGFVAPDIQAAMGMLAPLQADPGKTRARARAALDALLTRPEVDDTRIAAIGFCFGGTMALELARSGANLRAVVGFHAGLSTVAPKSDAKAIGAKILVCIGADDPMIDNAQRAAFEDEMRGGKVDYQLHVYGNTVHSFTNKQAAAANMPDAVRYSPDADARSWAAMRELFGEALA